VSAALNLLNADNFQRETPMPQKYMKRLYDLRAFARFLDEGLSNLDDLRTASRNGVDRQFGERIMLAVTEVNGCRYCSYFHSRQALEAGVSQEEIKDLMSGEIAAAPEQEQVALLFAQHYAETAGRPDQPALQRLRERYGEKKADGIVAYIRMIMIGNVYGNAFDAFRHRLMLKPVSEGSIGEELGVLVGGSVLIPWILIRNFFGKAGTEGNRRSIET
jgi:AhpD family alkylhydroperoxidase